MGLVGVAALIGTLVPVCCNMGATNASGLTAYEEFLAALPRCPGACATNDTYCVRRNSTDNRCYYSAAINDGSVRGVKKPGSSGYMLGSVPELAQTFCNRAATATMIKVEDANDAVFIAKLARAFVEVKHKKQDKVCTLLGVVRSLGKTTWTDFSATKYLERFPAGNEICLGADGALYNKSEKLVHVMCQYEIFALPRTETVTKHLRTSSTIGGPDNISETGKESTVVTSSTASNERLWIKQSTSVPLSEMQSTPPTTETLTTLSTTSSKSTTPFEMGKESTSLPQSTTFNERLPIASTLSKTIITHETDIELTSGHFNNMSSSEAMTASFHSVQAATMNESTFENISMETVGSNDKFMSDLKGTSTTDLTETAGSSQIRNISRPTSGQPPSVRTTGDYSMPAATTQPSAKADFISSRVTDKRPSSPQLEEEDEDEQKGKRLVAIMIVFLLVFEAGSLISAVLTYNNVI